MGKAGKTLRNLLCAGIFGLVSALLPSCKPENYPPEAKLDVNPVSGEVPLNVRMKVTGIDTDGEKDIHWYSLNVNNKEIKRRYPIDTTMTFENPGIVKIYGKVIDSENQMDKTDVSSIEVYERSFIEQFVSLVNDLNIKYDAVLSRVNSAELKINKDGILFLTKNINDVNQSGADYSKTFNNSLDGIIKGIYEFILKSGNLEKRNSVVVPNYNPSIDAGNLNIDLNEEAEKNIILPTPSDKNPEDNPVAIKSAISLDGKTELIMDGYNLRIKALPNYTGKYKIEVEYGSSGGGLEKLILEGNIIPDTRIEVNPFVQPNDSTSNWYGSGDVTNDNVVNGQDLTRLNQLIDGTYSDPNDKRLNDRADVNGDGTVNNEDKQILGNKLNGSIYYMPGEWNKLTTRAERENWLRKMLAIDETSEIPGSTPNWSCVQYSDQTYINFHGFSKLGDISELLQDSPNLNLLDNGRFNLPLYEVIIVDYDLNGNSVGGHAMNIAILEESALNWNDLSNVEPQNDHINVQPGEDYIIGTNSKFYICGFHGVRTKYIQYDIKNNIPILLWTNPDVNIKNQR